MKQIMGSGRSEENGGSERRGRKEKERREENTEKQEARQPYLAPCQVLSPKATGTRKSVHKPGVSLTAIIASY